MAEISFTSQAGQSKIISIDATIEEIHSAAATVTEFAVEKGVAISDHVRPENAFISMEIVITNTPIDQPRSHTDGAFGRIQPTELLVETRRNVRDLARGVPVSAIVPFPVSVGANFAGAVEQRGTTTIGVSVFRFTGARVDRVSAVYNEILNIIANGLLCKITTRLRIYENMALEMAETPRTAADGSSIRMRLQARQVRIVSTETVEVTEPAVTRGDKTQRRGAQKPTVPSTGQTEKLRSFADQLVFGAEG
jgi:hypothetical protein